MADKRGLEWAGGTAGHGVLRSPGDMIIDVGAATNKVGVTWANASGLYMVKGTLTTTDATVTAIATIAVPAGACVSVRSFIQGIQSTDEDHVTATAVGGAINAAGTTALDGTPLYQIVEGDAATNITITADNTTDTIRVNVTGVAAETWYWQAFTEFAVLVSA